MPVSLRLVHSLIELWGRRDEPDGPDVPQSLHVARELEADADAPSYLRGFAWHLVTDIHRAAGWPIPDTENLALCHGAASSIEHASALLLSDIASAIGDADAPVLVLGALAAGRSLFDRWDLLAARGALLIPLVQVEEESTLVDVLANQQGIHWGRPGSLIETLRLNSREVDLGGRKVRVPTAAMIAARAAEIPGPPADISSFLFCAAAYHAANHGTWHVAQIVAQRLGRDAALRTSAIRSGLDDWLGIQVPPAAKITVRIRELLTAPFRRWLV